MFWAIKKPEIAAMKAFPVGLLLRPGGFITVGCRPFQVGEVIKMVEGWGLEFGTLAFRKHYPYKRSVRAWKTTKNYILREDLQEVVVIAYRPPYNARGLWLFRTKNRPFPTNFPTRWEYDHYWKLSMMWGYPRLEIWARPHQGVYNPKKWTRIGPLLDGMPITQSLWLEHAKRFIVPLDLS
jgi:hypothetical protein